MDIAESAALAATAAPIQGAEDAIRRAALRGGDAAERGVALPLPLLLDLAALLRGPVGSRAFRTLRPADPRGEAYESWLADFISATRDFNKPAGRRRSGGGGEWEFAPLLPSLVPPPRRLDRLSAGFRELAGGRNAQKTLASWRGTRTLAGWGDWFPKDFADFTIRDWEGGAWAQFATAMGSRWLDERCDHEAARIYLEAADPVPHLDQASRIGRLRCRRPLFEPNPRPQSYVEQSLFYGGVLVGTLVKGRHGEFEIVNRSDRRLSDPNPIRPPRTVHVHLCWAHGPGGMERAIPARAPARAEPAMGTAVASEVSVLQAFCALLFDDFRSALVWVDVRLHAHCGAPDLAADDFGRPGKRWKPSRMSGPMPPRAVGRFFERPTWLSLAARGLSWRTSRSASAWWCLALLKGDLDEFGLRSKDGGGLECKADALPACVSTVIVLDPEGRGGTMYEALPPVHGERRQLRPLPARRAAGNDSFESLRLQALDGLLDAMEGLK